MLVRLEQPGYLDEGSLVPHAVNSLMERVAQSDTERGPANFSVARILGQPRTPGPKLVLGFLGGNPVDFGNLGLLGSWRKRFDDKWDESRLQEKGGGGTSNMAICEESKAVVVKHGGTNDLWTKN